MQENLYEDAIRELKNVQYESTKGMHMAPDFEGKLRCYQLEMISSVLLESASEIEGVNCFLPVHLLPTKKKNTIRTILEKGLSEIIGHAKQKSLLGQYRITQQRQDQLDPYLAGFYNSYSLASNFTQPYQADIPDEILFSVNTNFIAEGEEDLVQVKLKILYQTHLI